MNTTRDSSWFTSLSLCGDRDSALKQAIPASSIVYYNIIKQENKDINRRKKSPIPIIVRSVGYG